MTAWLTKLLTHFTPIKPEPQPKHVQSWDISSKRKKR